VLNTGFDCGFTYEPICNLTLYGDFIYNNANYRSLTTREDDSYEAHARLAYVFCRYYEFSVGYNYQENDSTNAGSKYRNQIGYARIAFKY
jgi:hypothetical protein